MIEVPKILIHYFMEERKTTVNYWRILLKLGDICVTHELVYKFRINGIYSVTQLELEGSVKRYLYNPIK